MSLSLRSLATLNRAIVIVLINVDSHRASGSHWLAIYFRPNSSSFYFFDSYCILQLVHSLEAFIRRNLPSGIKIRDNCRVERVKSAANIVVYSPSTRTGPKEIIGLFDAKDALDRQIDRIFASEFGPLRRGGGGEYSSSFL